MEGFLQLRESIINIPGVKGEHIFYQISDAHISFYDNLSTEEEKQFAEKAEKAWDWVKKDFALHFNEPFNKEHKIPSYEAFSKLVEYCKDKQCESLLLSGDILDYIHPAGLRYMRKQLSDYGKNYMFVPGNHENSYSANPIMTEFNNNSDGVTKYHGDGFIIAAVDDAAKTVSSKQLEEIKTLAYGEIPVVLLMHIPVSNDFNREEMSCYDKYYLIDSASEDKNASEFVKIISDCKSNIRGIICGHVHGFRETLFAEKRKQICASSGLVGALQKIIIRGE